MATRQRPGSNALLDGWLTLQNQGQNYGTGEGDNGAQTDWAKLFGGAADQYETAQRFGYAGAMPVDQSAGGDSSVFQPGNPQQELFDWMQSSGYGYGINPTVNGGQFNTWLDPQGNPIEGTQREFAAPDDSAFWTAAKLAALVASGAAGGYFGGAEAGASGLSGMDLAADAALGSGNNIMTAGGQFGGGLGGGTMLSAADAGIGQFPAGMEGYSFGNVGAGGGGFDPVGAYMTSGAAEGSTMAGSLTGAGGASGAVGAGTTAGTLGSIGNALGSLGGSLGTANSIANLAQAGIGMYGQNKAIGAMKDATNQSNEFNRYAFDQIRADNQPLVDMRNSVLPQIQGLLKNPGSITSDPGYQFQFGEGQKALNNGAAARGMTYSGAQGKALQRYGNDYGATKLDQSLNRLTSVAGLGQVGSNSNNAATQNYANNQSGNALNLGNARGSAYGNMANIGGNALGQIYNPWQWYQVNGRGP